jgi:hypothetical protein
MLAAATQPQTNPISFLGAGTLNSHLGGKDDKTNKQNKLRGP